MLQPFPADTSG